MFFMKKFLMNPLSSALILSIVFLAFSNSLQAKSDLGAMNVYTPAEVAKHNVPKDCWLTINDSVYDLTTFIVNHQGGSSAITRLCGKDATAAFENVGHSDEAIAERETFKIGTIAL
jgi:cytochrome b involved in lipid metabolism